MAILKKMAPNQTQSLRWYKIAGNLPPKATSPGRYDWLEARFSPLSIWLWVAIWMILAITDVWGIITAWEFFFQFCKNRNWARILYGKPWAFRSYRTTSTKKQFSFSPRPSIGAAQKESIYDVVRQSLALEQSETRKHHHMKAKGSPVLQID